MASMKSAHDLLIAEVKDLYSAEKQLTKAIPKMAAGAKDAALKAGLLAHLDQTKQQVRRLETIAGILAIKVSGKLCKGMEGVIMEGEEALSAKAPQAVYDLGIIAAARRAEHYEMAGYMTAIALAEGLKLNDVIQLLKETLAEEKGAEDSLKGMIPQLVSQSLTDDGMPAASETKQRGKSLARTA
jgi:ferritin-like metal-binding protein YciE